jgi:hypothetical protein
MRPYNSDDEGVKVLDEFTARRLVLLANAGKAADQVERRLVFGHAEMWANSGTTGKTASHPQGYTATDAEIVRHKGVLSAKIRLSNRYRTIARVA